MTAGRVVLVGPRDVRSAHPLPPEAAEEAVACIDDRYALIDDAVMSVDELWTDLLRRAAGPAPAEVDVVVPSWWPSRRTDRVVAAAVRAGLEARVLRRADMMRGNASHVVEVAPELVVVHPPHGSADVVARVTEPAAVVDAVVDLLRHGGPVVVDDPVGELGTEIAERLRARHVEVVEFDDASLVDAAASERPAEDRPPTASRYRAVAALGAAATVAALVTASLWPSVPEQSPPRTWLVEGRVTLEVPADWMTERIVDGPGSARVRVSAPDDRRHAMHVTQSPIPVGQSLSAAAEVVRAALAEQPDGVFTEFEPSATVAGLPAITYREDRPDARVQWTLRLDGHVRIAIGCQRAPDVSEPDEHCLHAIRTAREWA
ncbi:type VII secretion-associated protein [Mycolicibacterium sp. GCM10028919]|uniref:type VII secretion-associated protein n=1 Tax=Mycolicibacterium sp. GCM10028919 TaxID=3273401 RepID=UPI00361DAE18